MASVLGFWASRGAEEKLNVLSDKATRTFIFYNSKVDNSNNAHDWQVLADEQPDFLALVEVDKPQTVNLYSVFPKGCGTSSEGIFGIVLLAKQPLEICEVKKIGFFPYIRAIANGVALLYFASTPANRGTGDGKSSVFGASGETDCSRIVTSNGGRGF
ncbi:hypothetical protein [Suttonella ornithocola]|uniref:hypothetical protein n=1 Tax=Suttonella ornithocola TaxID=279832 RepID=UPI000E1C3FC0|nr:hypothetical protein [Suttonella ornithocola]